MEANGGKRFLVDGFPRNKDNLTGWDAAMHRGDVDVEAVLFYDCPEATMEARLLGRVVARCLDGVDDLTSDVRSLFCIREGGLRHPQLVVLELAAHHCYGAASSPMLRRGQGWPQRRRGGCKQQQGAELHGSLCCCSAN